MNSRLAGTIRTGVAAVGLAALLTACTQGLGSVPPKSPQQGIESTVTASYELGLMDGMYIAGRTPGFSQALNPPPGQDSVLASYRNGLRDGIKNTKIVEMYYGHNAETHTHVFLRILTLNDMYRIQVKTRKVGLIAVTGLPVVESESIYSLGGRVPGLDTLDEQFSDALKFGGANPAGIRPLMVGKSVSQLVRDIMSGSFSYAGINGKFDNPDLEAYR